MESLNHRTYILSPEKIESHTRRKQEMLFAAERSQKEDISLGNTMLFVDEAIDSARALGETDLSFISEVAEKLIQPSIHSLEKDLDLYLKNRSPLLKETIDFLLNRIPVWAKIAGENNAEDMIRFQIILAQAGSKPAAWWERLLSKLSG